jgi:hypothetical protein
MDPHTKTGIPEPVWGCNLSESPNRFGDPQTEMGPRTGLGIFQSLTHTGLGIIPIWGATLIVTKLERHSK